MVRSYERGIPACVRVGTLLLLIHFHSVTVTAGKIKPAWLPLKGHIAYIYIVSCLSFKSLFCCISVQLPVYYQRIVGHSVHVRLMLSLRAGWGWIFIHSTHPVPIYMSAGRRERRESPFAAWLCANLVTRAQCKNAGGGFPWFSLIFFPKL